VGSELRADSGRHPAPIDSNGDGMIELSELVRHVQSVVPNVAAGLVRAATPEPILGKQSARFGSHGEDFVLARRLP
jgi:hypothetical protein